MSLVSDAKILAVSTACGFPQAFQEVAGISRYMPVAPFSPFTAFTPFWHSCGNGQYWILAIFQPVFLHDKNAPHKMHTISTSYSNVRESTLLMVYWVLESISVLIHIDILKCLVVNSDHVQTMFRLCSDCSDCSDYVQTMFRLCSFNKMIFYLTTMCIIWFKSEHSLNIVWV